MHGVSPENAEYLRDLPLDWQDEFDGQRIFMCHGKPGSNIWGIYRDHVSDTLISMMLASLDADVLITGHTHIPMYIRVDNGIVVNPGSVYTFDSIRPTSHTYGILHLPDLSFDLYDVTLSPEEPLHIYER